MILGCIADDFTGATDLGGLLVRAGARVALYFGVPTDVKEVDADVAIIALKCRTEPVDSAIQQATEAGAWLLEQGAEQLYWKYCSTFDSTPQGNIGPVAEALMELTGHRQALYCPAFPENGRSVFKGHLFVLDELLSESPMRHHPLTPMTESSLVKVLEPQVSGSVGLWQRAAIKAGQQWPDTAHIIADAVEFDDLGSIVDQAWGKVLLTGGSALARPIPGRVQLNTTTAVVPEGIGTQSVVLAGSCSAQTRRQLQSYQHAPRYKINPLELATSGIEPIWDWWQQQAPTSACVIYASDDPASVIAVQNQLGTERAGALIEKALGDLAVRMLSAGVARFVVAGGETSGAVCKALNVSHVQVGQEISPGVPWTFAETEHGPIALALKSGNFGGDDFFSDAFRGFNG